MANRKNISKNYSKNYIKPLSIGVITGLITCSLLLTILSFIFTKSSSPPYTFITPIIFFTSGTGAFAGGYFASRISKQNGIIYGIACGFLMFILIFIAGLISVRESLTMTTLIRFLTMLILGSIGGILGVNRRIKK